MAFKNPHRISYKEVIADSGMTEDEALSRWSVDSIVPACCDEGCEVEPDGRCEHGCPSALIAAGLI